MWIRTQDRKYLCEVSKKIGIIHDNEDTDIPVGIFNYDSSLTMLGEYSTKERALKVLNELQESFMKFETYSNKKMLSFNETVYIMPLE
jgi:hypothetical protein